MSNTFSNIYIKFNKVLSGCRTIYDALFFAQYYIKSNPEYKSLIISMIYGKHYEKITDFRSIANILKILNNFETRNEIDMYINKNINKDNFDYSQLNALLRLGKTKTYVKNDIQNDIQNDDLLMISKNINNNLINLLGNNSTRSEDVLNYSE